MSQLDDAKGFADRLREAVEASDLSRLEISNRLEKYPNRLSEWENGKRAPSLDNLVQLVRVLGVDGHWLLTGEGSMRRHTDEECEQVMLELRGIVGRYYSPPENL